MMGLLIEGKSMGDPPSTDRLVDGVSPLLNLAFTPEHENIVKGSINGIWIPGAISAKARNLVPV